MTGVQTWALPILVTCDVGGVVVAVVVGCVEAIVLVDVDDDESLLAGYEVFTVLSSDVSTVLSCTIADRITNVSIIPPCYI